MDNLFIEIEIRTEIDCETEIFSSINSFIVLYVYKYLQSPGDIKLNFVCTTFPENQAKIKLKSEFLQRELTEEKIICKNKTKIKAIADLQLPVYVKDEDTFISGMCAVCREIVSRDGNPEHRKLLGFKEGSLLAPSETSVWTRFCEVDIITALEGVLTIEEMDHIPDVIPRFEQHMKEPVKMHNIYKLARENANKKKNRKGKVIINCSTPKEKLAIEHRFAEGISFTIADLILYPCFQLLFQRCTEVLHQFSLLSTWIDTIDEYDTSCLEVFTNLYCFKKFTTYNLLKSHEVPVCSNQSLYKSDPKRYKPKNRIFTEQSEVDATLAKLANLNLEFSSESEMIYDNWIDWDSIEPDHEENSDLPIERLERKKQQLQNLTNAVLSLAKDGDRIVDFCSGTGHLGILIALKLPHCTVTLLENKAFSLERAKTRAIKLGLKNCLFYQCNIDYFKGQFNIGTSLHACGTATDIVLKQCMRSLAKFVCCPCCYGSIQPMPHISYPLSEKFRTAVAEKDYLYIAHAADQAHDLGTLNCKPEITYQGQLCMDIVDSDRKLHAEEAGYKVILTRLTPENCTPKNRLLVGYLQ